jgi:hypothetical protein
MSAQVSKTDLPSDIKLPVIEYDKVLSGGVEMSQQAQKMVNAFTEFGFCMLSNIPEYNQEEVLKAVK